MQNEYQEKKNKFCAEGTYGCPIGRFISTVEKCLGITDDFKKHIYNSRVEFLKAIRSLIDRKIEDLESRISSSARRAEKIEVE
ncbi:MAG: hypothetical protein ACP5TY_12620 [Thermodesulforhabdaceae bacterium]|jgi:hypothetical protein